MNANYSETRSSELAIVIITSNHHHIITSSHQPRKFHVPFPKTLLLISLAKVTIFKSVGYFKNVLVSIDQLGNPDNTIFGRVGYFSQVSRSVTRYFWMGLEKIINFTFWPIDGPDHCRQAFEADPEEIFNDHNGDFFRALMSVVIISTCIPISIVLYIVWTIRKVSPFSAFSP